MARLTDSGTVVSDNGEWQWNPEGGSIKGGAWTRIAPPASKPGLMTRLLVKKSAQGKPSFAETMQAAKLQPSAGDRAIVAGLERVQDKLAAEVERRKAANS
jgi:hypothetical protein